MGFVYNYDAPYMNCFDCKYKAKTKVVELKDGSTVTRDGALYPYCDGKFKERHPNWKTSPCENYEYDPNAEKIYDEFYDPDDDHYEARRKREAREAAKKREP